MMTSADIAVRVFQLTGQAIPEDDPLVIAALFNQALIDEALEQHQRQTLAMLDQARHEWLSSMAEVMQGGQLAKHGYRPDGVASPTPAPPAPVAPLRARLSPLIHRAARYALVFLAGMVLSKCWYQFSPPAQTRPQPPCPALAQPALPR